MWGWNSFETLLQDVRYGLRQLRRNPSFTAVAVAVLALGIGSTTGVFSLLEAVLFRPFPVPASDRLVAIYTSGPKQSGYSSTSYPDYEYYRNHAQTLTDGAAYARIELSWTTGSQPEFTWAELVTGNYFSVLRVSPFLGRTFTPQEDRVPGASPVVVVSYGFWQRRLGSEPDVAGKTLMVNGHPFTIIGVAPRGFEGVNLDWGSLPDLWVPMAMLAEVMPGAPDLLNMRPARWLLVVARLKDGATLDQARAETSVLAGQLGATYPIADKGRTSILLPATQARFWPAYRPGIVRFLAILAVAAGLVVFVACSNVASLLLARASARQKEISIRLALGASGGRVVRQLVTESFLLAGGGAGAGLLVALFIMKWLPRFRLPFHIPVALDLRLDARVLAFTCMLSVASAFFFGLAPATGAARVDLNPSLKERGQAPTVGRFSLRNLLIVSEVALTTIALVGAALLLLTLQRLEATDPGFDPHHMLVVGVDLYTRGYSPAEEIRFSKHLIDRAATLPGVASTSMTRELALSLSRIMTHILIPGREATSPQGGFEIESNEVAPRYFETMKIPMLRGRDFRAQDDTNASPVVIVNRTMAQRFWPGQDAVGKRLRLVKENTECEIVGVVDDIKYHTLAENPLPYLYLPEFQDHSGMRLPLLVVRTEGNPISAVHAVRREVAALDKQVPVFDIETMDQQFADSLSQPRMGAALVTLFGVLALVMAAAGIYGMLACMVTERTHEIGIRMALGAQRRDVLKLVVGQGFKLTLVGVGIGIVAAFALTRFLASMLYGIKPTDPATFSAVSAILIGVALLACYIPARGATKVDPIVALRYG